VEAGVCPPPFKKGEAKKLQSNKPLYAQSWIHATLQEQTPQSFLLLKNSLSIFHNRFLSSLSIRFTIMSLNPQQEKILTAFVTALAQQDESLPLGLQKQLNAIGQNLESRVVELPTIAASLPTLNQAYQVALSDTQTDKGDQGATLVSTNQDRSAKLREHAAQILTDSDPVQAAQRNQYRGLGQIATNPLKRFFGRG
jgi:hypothetical protein